jgi:hypothetical protein
MMRSIPHFINKNTKEEEVNWLIYKHTSIKDRLNQEVLSFTAEPIFSLLLSFLVHFLFLFIYLFFAVMEYSTSPFL